MLNAIYDLFVADPNFETASLPDRERITATNRKKGVSVIAWVAKGLSLTGVPPPIMAVVKLRTHGSGYRNLRRERVPDIYTAQEIYRSAVEALLYKPMDPNALPKPWEFNLERYEIVAKRTGWFGRHGGPLVTLKSVIRAAEVIKVVAIGNDAIMTDTTINDPDQPCWYLLDCIGHSEATFNIISDGEVFYPVSRFTQSTRTIRLSNGSGKQTADLTQASIADKELVNAAIEAWVAKLLSVDPTPSTVA